MYYYVNNYSVHLIVLDVMDIDTDQTKSSV